MFTYIQHQSESDSCGGMCDRGSMFYGVMLRMYGTPHCLPDYFKCGDEV